MSAQREVRVGQRFRAMGSGLFGRPAAVWQVTAVWQAPDGRIYATLVRPCDPTESKTLAADALLDRTLYRSVEGAEGG